MDGPQWIILICGVAGVALSQTERLQKYACIAGLAGQIGWFSAISPHSQPGIWLTCVAYCAAWTWGFWRYWMASWLSMAVTPTDATTPSSPCSPTRGAGTTTRPKLRRVK